VAEQHDAVEVITTKRDGGRLSDSMVDWVVDAYTRGVVADEQMSALAMAILLNGMDRSEIARWTDAMIASGERMDFSGLSRPTSDKHSTGGVGDKVTLPLAPLVAACGGSDGCGGFISINASPERCMALAEQFGCEGFEATEGPSCGLVACARCEGEE